MHGPAAFRFLSVNGHLAAPADWDDPVQTRLWRYNLHYFDDLTAQGAEERADWHLGLVARWVQENPPGRGTGWEPYPTSLRIVNWVKWELANAARGTSVLDASALDSLAVQARWLCQRLEIHLLANHLWANAKALVVAGLFFEGPEAQAWLGKGVAILRRELDEQILPDGGHFERSPMYHATLLEDVMDLINVARVFEGVFPAAMSEVLIETGARMLHWLRVMSHPDGRISFFNDAAFGIAPDYAELSAYASRLGVALGSRQLASIEPLADSGYVRLQTERATVICDVAPLGPDYLPGHAHADTLSFELSVDGRRVMVNGGTSTYEPGTERLRQRGTSSHNTVVVDSHDSSEVWGSFRVARRARPFDVAWGADAEGVWLVGAHDGYRRLPGRVVHRRRWMLSACELSITDRLEGRFSSACAVFGLHPSVSDHTHESTSAAVLSLQDHPARIRLKCEPSARVSSGQSTWHPRFGEALVNKTLTARFEAASLVTRLSW